MIRQFFGDVLAALRNAMLPEPRKTANPAPAAPETKAVTQETVQFTPPRFDDTATRVPAIDPKVAANYWREALSFLNFQALARNTDKQSKPLLIYPLDLIVEKAGVSQHDSGNPKPKDEAKAGAKAGTTAEEEVNVVLCLWQNESNGTTMPKGLRHPIFSVPATLIDKQFLAPRTNAVPELNDRYLTPDIQKGCFGLGDKEEANAILIDAFSALLDDKTASPGWASWWDTCLDGLYRILGIDNQTDPAALLASRANELLKKPLKWTLVAAVYPASGGGTQAVADLYENLAQVMDDYVDDTALFRALCGTSNAKDIATASTDTYCLLSGHIDEHEEGKRALFPLDATQRNAVRAILTLMPGQIQAVNGPPGSGKTAMLRAVVASKWVTAALKNEPCPIIIACGATNQSVTNVIEAFGNAPHPDNTIAHARRWIDHASSYGAFLPSASYKSEAKNQAEIAKTVCIEKVESAVNCGFLYRYYQRTDVLNPADALDFEATYLQRGRAALDKPQLGSVEDIVLAVWTKLHQTVKDAEQFLQGTGDQRRQMGNAYLARHGQHWTPTRKTLAEESLHQNGNAQERLESAHQFIDLAWRAEAFHWAARYWEGEFLLAQRTRLMSAHPNNVEAALRRLCMLTPCLVSTLHTVPQFAQIDRNVTAQDEQRTHVFGVVDLLVLDEAGQALPEMAGAAFALAKSAAVVGDLMQLAPISTSSPLAEIAVAHRSGASTFLEAIVRTRRSIVSGSALGMARLVSRWREADDDGVMLRYHYRCKPSIIDYCNHLCYNGTLRPKTDESAAFPEPALAWVNIEAEPKPVGGSQCNREEADAIIAWIVERWSAWQTHEKTRAKAIHEIVAIVTPYKAQSDYLSQQLKAAFAVVRLEPGKWPSDDDINKVTIGTVHRLQGAERPIVCFSLVEGPAQCSGSFIDRDATLMNVAVSRAKSVFIIFANPKRLFPESSPLPGQTGQILLPVHQLGAHLRTRPEARLLYPEKLVLIEAGGKLKAMQAILGKPCAVVATGGALHKLSLTDGVRIDAGFVPKPSLEAQADAALTKARAILNNVGELVFATDDDRMGEYIAWQAQRLLGDALAGKTLRRVRLGAITPAAVTHAFTQTNTLDENLILAEAVREVVDCLIAQRFARLSKTQVAGDANTIVALAQCGACTEPRIGSVKSMGRVQGAVLRMLLMQAKHTLDNTDQFRIRASVVQDGLQFIGHVFNIQDQRAITTQKAALAFCQRPPKPLMASAPPGILQETITAPLAGTIDVLIAAWEKATMLPWDTMAALQSLYDGSWNPHQGKPEPILEPIPEISTASGHPPLRPLDRSATPEQLRSVMPSHIHTVYSIIWDYYLASECASLRVRHGVFTYAITDKLVVKFENAECEGLDDKLKYLLFDRTARQRYDFANGMFDAWRDIINATPTYTPEPFIVWDMRPDKLLRLMADNRIGRPSTFARALEKLYTKGLIEFPAGDGPLRLTPDGLASAMALERDEPELSSPDFSGTLTQLLDDIETGERGPRDVLSELMPELTPDEDVNTVGPRIWNTLAELEAAMAMPNPAQPVFVGPMVTSSDAGKATRPRNSTDTEP